MKSTEAVQALTALAQESRQQGHSGGCEQRDERHQGEAIASRDVEAHDTGRVDEGQGEQDPPRAPPVPRADDADRGER